MRERERDLIAINEILPLAFALFGAPPEPSLPHLGAHHLPKRLVPLRRSEVPFQLGAYRYELPRLLLAPLRLRRNPLLPPTRRRRRRYLAGDHRRRCRIQHLRRRRHHAEASR